MRRLSLLLLVLVATAAGAAGQRPLYDGRFFTPVEELVTPHITWAKPYATPPKVLFITYRDGMREVVELAQRLSMDYTVFAMQSRNTFGETGIGVDAGWRLVRGNSAPEMTENLNNLLTKDYDVIVAGDIKWDEIPLECRYEILKKVKAGTGLVGSIPPRGRDEFLNQLLKTAQFGWNYGTWSGAAQGIADYFGTGVFDGSVDYSGGHTGQAALRIECKSITKGSKESARAGYSLPTLQLEPNAEYVFSMWTKTVGLSAGGASVSLSPYPLGVPVPASADWKYTEVKFKTNDKNTKAGVYLLNWQPGTVWYDDVKLVRAGTDTNLLSNSSFEFPGPAPTELAQGVPYRQLPAFAKYTSDEAFLRGVFQTATFRKGRIGFVNYGVGGHQLLTPGPSGPVQYCRADYDYYLELAAKLILWGARKSPQVNISAGGGATAPLEAGKGTQLPVSLNSAVATPGATVVLNVRQPYDETGQSLKQTVSLKAGDNRVTFNLPPLPAGTSYANCWVLQGKQVIGFGSLGLPVTSPVRIGEIKFDQGSFRLREPLVGKITCQGDAAGCKLRLSARDMHGRLLAQQVLPPTGPETAFKLPMLQMTTIVGWLTVELQQGQQIVDVRRADFTVNNLFAPRDDVQFVMWQGYGNDFIMPMMAEEFSRNGIDSFYDGGGQGYGPYANQWWLPYATRFTDTKTDWYQLKPTREAGDLVRDPCLTDPAYRQKVRELLTNRAQAGLRISTSDFTLGDENMFVAGNWDLCFSATCNEDFRRWAKEVYGSLDKLNAEWGSSYKDWSEVLPQTLEQCKRTGNFVPWVDHRLHMETVWAGIHDYSRNIIKETVPYARVGYEGSDTVPTSWQADDYWKLSRVMNLNNIYYRDFLSLAMRDFSSPDTLLGGGWFGGYPGNRNEPFMRWFPWRTLFKGSNSFWVWMGYGSEGAVMAPDVSLYPFFKSACDEIAEIKAGTGKLLMATQREHDGIALLWSASSVHVGTATPQFPDMDSLLTSLVTVLHDTGLEAKVLSYAELAQGKLTNQDFKVLLLPGSQALSAAEVEAVKQFVRGGGTVVADLRPGVTDEHGKPYSTRALDEVFGVTQAPQFKSVLGPLEFAGSPETSGAGLQLTSVQADGSLALADGQALSKIGTAPALVVKQYGRGRGILLNFNLKGYLAVGKGATGDFAGWAEGAAYRQFLAGILKTAQVQPQVTVAPDAPHVEISRFAAEARVEYIGIVQSLPLPEIQYTNKEAAPPTARPVTINFGRQAQVYDMRAGKYLGAISTLKTQMTPGVAQLYALLPYKLTQVSVQTSAQTAVGTNLTYSVKLGVPARAAQHVLRVQVVGPDGQPRPWYAKNLTVKQGVAQGTIPLALNEQPGAWKIVARDVATGVTATATCKVIAQ